MLNAYELELQNQLQLTIPSASTSTGGKRLKLEHLMAAEEIRFAAPCQPRKRLVAAPNGRRAGDIPLQA